MCRTISSDWIELTYLTADHLLPGHKKTFGDDRNTCCLGCGGGYTGLCICQSTSECLLETVTFYVYYTLIKLIFKIPWHCNDT